MFTHPNPTNTDNSAEIMSVFELNEIKVTPDIIQDYSDDLKNSTVPIVIDNGSYQCRVGWANQMEPSMIFKNIIAKPRKDRSKKEENSNVQPPTQIGNDIINIEALRFQLKTQFDRNVVTHYHTQEQIFDYIFTHLGITTEGCIQHPIVMTECFANPNYCRNLMSELLFECYDIPAVCYGIDSLFGFKHNQHNSGLIISCGFQSTHVIPMLNGEVCANKTRRINLGGYHMVYFMHRLLQLKYPVHVNAVTISRVERLLHEHCSIAYDYQESLRKWAKLEYYEESVKKIQLPYTQIITVAPTAEQKTEKKRELARRLTEINARKREEKLAEDEEMIQKLSVIKELNEDGDTAEVKYQLKENSLANMEEVDKMIVTINSRIEKTKQKIAYMEANNAPPVVIEEKPAIPQPPTDLSMEEWIIQTRNKRATLLERRHARRQRKQDLAKRRTAAAQERMRIISQLARKEKGTDDFGMRDEDWDIYKTISKEGGDSDSETENEKLIELEEILRHHDSTFEEPQLIQGGAAESYQLHVGVEAIRAPELLFQPSMIGSSEAGLVETIDYVLKQFSEEEQLILVNNLFLTGGCSKFPGLYKRLSRELMEIRPFQSTYKITTSKDPSLDAWYGARDFANSEELSNYLVTKQIYDEMGGEYLVQHAASNLYFQTPAPTIIPETPTEQPLL